MEKTYDAPELSFIGEASDVVMGLSGSAGETFGLSAPDFGFEDDEL
jgi:hypothetical protein